MHYLALLLTLLLISCTETKNNIKPSNSSPPTILKKILKDRQYQVKYADIFVQKGHQSNILSTLFTHDGQFIISASRDSLIKLWEVKTGHEIHTFKGHKNGVKKILLLADGKTLLSAGGDKTIKLWDIKSGRLLRSIKTAPLIVDNMVLTKDQKNILTVHSDRSIRLWNLASGQQLKTFKSHNRAVKSIDITPDGKHFISASLDQTLKVWEIETGDVVQTMLGHHDGIHIVKVSPDGKYALSGGDDKSVKLWDIETGDVIFTFYGHTNLVLDIVFSKDGLTAASASWDKTILLLNLSTGQVSKTLKLNEPVSSISLSSNQQQILAAGKQSLKLWDIKSGQLIQVYQGFRRQLNKIAGPFYNANSKQLFLTSFKKDNPTQLYLWDLQTTEVKAQINTGFSAVESMTMPAGSKFIFSGHHDHSIKMIDVKTQQLIKQFHGHHHVITALLVSANGKILVSGSRDTNIKIWSIATGKLLKTIRGHKQAISSLALSSNGNKLLSASRDGTIKYWDVNKGKLIGMIPTQSKPVNQILFTDDGDKAISSAGNQLILWDLDEFIAIHQFHGHQKKISNFSISTDDKKLVSASIDGVIKTWDLKSYDNTDAFQTNLNSIAGLAFYDKNQRYLVAGEQGEIVSLNQNLNENIRGFHFRNGDWLSMTPEGYFHGSNNAGRFLNARSKRKVLSINQFFHDLHRPDLVYLKHQNKQQFKTSKKTNIAIQLKKAKPPYIKSVEQLKPLNNNEVQIKTILENEGSGFGDIFYWLNGKLVATKKIDFISSKTIEIKQSIKLPTGNSQLSVTATNAENKLVSNKKILMLKNTSVIKPVLYVLTASHDKYVNLPSSIELKHSHWDARYFAKIIKQHNKKSYQQVVVESLIGQSFTNDGINKSVKKVKQKMQENDALIIYLTGLTNHDASDFYYLPMNATKLSTSPNNQISIKQLAHQFDHTDSQKIVMLLNINPSQSIKGINNNHISMQYRNIIQHINKQTGVNILLIPKIDQLIDLAFEEKSKMTLFVNQMLRNSDKLGNKDGLISLKELFLYFKNNYDLGDISSQSQFNEFDFVLMKEK